MYLTKDELTTHLRVESITAITRDDPTLAESAIDGAISEAKGYLTRYDTNAIFNTIGEERNALLLIFVKDIAAWHLVNIVNPNIDLKLREKRYDRAIEWLKGVQKALIEPSLPVAPEKDPSLTHFGSTPNKSDW